MQTQPQILIQIHTDILWVVPLVPVIGEYPALTLWRVNCPLLALYSCDLKLQNPAGAFLQTLDHYHILTDVALWQFRQQSKNWISNTTWLGSHFNGVLYYAGILMCLVYGRHYDDDDNEEIWWCWWWGRGRIKANENELADVAGRDIQIACYVWSSASSWWWWSSSWQWWWWWWWWW